MDTRPEPALVATTCPYCGVGCGVMAEPSGVHGNQAHPANFGRLCVKGSALHETLKTDGRLLEPRVRGDAVSWDTALSAVSDAIADAVARFGPGSVAFYLSGQLLTEDYFVANKLAKGFIGTPHVDTNSRLCMSSAVAAHKRAFGEDCVPGCYEDFELADLLVLAGSNAAWAHPVLYQRMEASHRAGRRVVVIDPRKTATSELADLHLQLKPGTDTILFNGLLAWLNEQGAVDQDYLDAHCDGYQEALESAQRAAPSVSEVARQCDLEVADVETFYQWYADTPRTVTAFSQGINQSVAGTDKCNAIINCHLATGRVGKPGAGPFSLTGQPNAMGGREVGGLANTLAAHMEYDTPGARELISGFWGNDALPESPGLKAVDLFEAVHRGDIRVLWIMGTNPAVSLPDSPRVRQALARCPTVIVSDCMAETDTTAFADILLPAAGWGEKDGTVTNSERRVSRQKSFLPLPGDVRPDWWMISAVARELGYGDAFSYQGPADVFREHAALCGLASVRTGTILDLSGLQNLSDDEYQGLEPIQWPVRSPSGGGISGTPRLFSDGVFATPNGRARLVSVETALPAQQPSGARPLVVNAGRIRDQWHTMTRTAKASRLLSHRSEPFIEVNPEDARRIGLSEGGLGRLSGHDGASPYVGRIRITGNQRQGEVFVPIHWSGQFASQGLASNLIAAVTDPVSGQPESKHGTAELKPLATRWQARLLRRGDNPWRQEDEALCDYWSRQPLSHCESWWLAGGWPVHWQQDAASWMGGEPDVMLADAAEGRFRAARIVDGQLQAVLLVGPCAEALPDLAWLDQCFAAEQLSREQRQCLLAGRAVDTEDTGNLVCSCFQVGEKQITGAICAGHASVDALGKTLKCGTNCGSCIPELRGLLEKTVVALEPVSP
ncbi:molybdopterin-dependent oxidoreductase [Marinobacter salinexigens]|uniref:Molybdopterin-dependent oxidoreductase n=1 Tax=Marinobacter salinexigens TaxID=2919747 RepID=A0A5B0VI29_9GAMM|nr:nitrate reductase [Marinobacter salinexigens]KAA1174282.1 molybdopterin-dependent oxidoreductase [Marinobacter salinexigens]